MADVHSPEVRSYNMSRIHGKDTKTEEIVRKFLFAQGFRYRKNDKRFPGKPDIVLPKYHTIGFVNGCFWHAHKGCKWFVMPKTNTDFWKTKLQNNIDRDSKNYASLKQMGWKVLVVWECEIRHGDRNKYLQKLVKSILEE